MIETMLTKVIIFRLCFLREDMLFLAERYRTGAPAVMAELRFSLPHSKHQTEIRQGRW